MSLDGGKTAITTTSDSSGIIVTSNGVYLPTTPYYVTSSPLVSPSNETRKKQLTLLLEDV